MQPYFSQKPFSSFYLYYGILLSFILCSILGNQHFICIYLNLQSGDRCGAQDCRKCQTYQKGVAWNIDKKTSFIDKKK